MHLTIIRKKTSCYILQFSFSVLHEIMIYLIIAGVRLDVLPSSEKHNGEKCRGGEKVGD